MLIKKRNIAKIISNKNFKDILGKAINNPLTKIILERSRAPIKWRTDAIDSWVRNVKARLNRIGVKRGVGAEQPK